MLYYMDFIIYLWLFPVFLFLFLPLIIGAAGIPLTLTRRFFYRKRRQQRKKTISSFSLL